MLSKIKTVTLHGLNGYIVSVQIDISAGLPCFEIVGLPDIIVKEAKERVKSAIKNSGYEFFSRRIIVNLAPASLRKEGSFFDLPIAVGILIATGCVYNPSLESYLSDTIFLGELSLDGNIEKINGILPICIEAQKFGIKRIILPQSNSKEASVIKNLEIIPVNNLIQLVDFLNGNLSIKPQKHLEFNFKENYLYNFDFSEVKGQENVKRALEIAAAGGHNCLLIGNIGSGKTMLARRLPSILPDVTFEESLEITKIHSICGLVSESQPLIISRPFRSPHHTITTPSLIGGGKSPQPGEISLAHLGVLYLDELPEFNKSTLESLRSPLEDGFVSISRSNSSVTYPCKFMFISSMNPCPCGYFGSKDKSCSCTELQIKKYINKISGPLLDRIDIHIEVENVKYYKLDNETFSENSASIRKRVNIARNIQLNRYKKYHIFSNSELSPNLINKFCKLDSKCKKILEYAFEKLGLSARAYDRILKVARTISDLDSSEFIKPTHLSEAIQYRSLDRKYWKR